jgi:hypothetical protein
VHTQPHAKKRTFDPFCDLSGGLKLPCHPPSPPKGLRWITQRNSALPSPFSTSFSVFLIDFICYSKLLSKLSNQLRLLRRFPWPCDDYLISCSSKDHQAKSASNIRVPRVRGPQWRRMTLLQPMSRIPVMSLVIGLTTTTIFNRPIVLQFLQPPAIRRHPPLPVIQTCQKTTNKRICPKDGVTLVWVANPWFNISIHTKEQVQRRLNHSIPTISQRKDIDLIQYMVLGHIPLTTSTILQPQKCKKLECLATRWRQTPTHTNQPRPLITIITNLDLPLHLESPLQLFHHHLFTA